MISIGLIKGMYVFCLINNVAVIVIAVFHFYKENYRFVWFWWSFVAQSPEMILFCFI